MIEQLNLKEAAKSKSHYSPAVKSGNTIYISGQLPINPVTREKCGDDIKTQTKQVFANMEEILKLAGADRNNIVKTTAYIADINLWGELNEAYADFFGGHKPARSIIEVSRLHFDLLVEIEAIAILDE